MRCNWADYDPLMAEYHDKEWGVPLFDDRKQFEFLSLEVMQCGLSWMTVLKKREALNKVFDGFEPGIVSRYDETKIESIMAFDGIIHSIRKVRAIVNNAKCFLRIKQEFGSFSNYIWHFTDGRSVEYPGHADVSVFVARNELSDTISADLKKRGFSFLGSVTVYSHLQASGVINDHMDYCFRYKELKEKGIQTR